LKKRNNGEEANKRKEIDLEQVLTTPNNVFVFALLRYVRQREERKKKRERRREKREKEEE
jgi:hypothetical protein